jgi:hypothetical protein
VASHGCGANRNAGGQGSLRQPLWLADKSLTAPVFHSRRRGVGPRPKIARWSAERGPVRYGTGRAARLGGRASHARHNKRVPCRRSIHPSVGVKWDCWCRQITAGSPAEALAKGGCEEERQSRTPERVAGTKKTALFDIVRRDCGQRFASRFLRWVPALVPFAQAALAALGRDTRSAVSRLLGMTSYARLVFFLARRFFGGGLNTMPSSFMPSGSVK